MSPPSVRTAVQQGQMDTSAIFALAEHSISLHLAPDCECWGREVIETVVMVHVKKGLGQKITRPWFIQRGSQSSCAFCREFHILDVGAVAHYMARPEMANRRTLPDLSKSLIYRLNLLDDPQTIFADTMPSIFGKGATPDQEQTRKKLKLCIVFLRPHC